MKRIAAAGEEDDMANDPMLVIDDTLVLINLSPDNHRIPAHGPNGEAIRYVGERAAPTDHKILIVEEGIEEVRAQNAQVLELPTTVRRCPDAYPAATLRIWRRLPKRRWRELLHHSIRAADGRRILTCSPAQLDLSLHASVEKHIIHWIPEDASELICAKERISNRQQMTDAYACLGIRRDRSDICPLASLTELARSGQTVQLNPDAEAMSDSYLRSTPFRWGDQSGPPRDITYLMTADAPIDCRDAEDVLALFTLRDAVWYFCSTAPITYRGQRYAVGCLNELSPTGICPYHRREVAVFSGDGLVSDRKITEAVYEKFLLMSFM